MLFPNWGERALNGLAVCCCLLRYGYTSGALRIYECIDPQLIMRLKSAYVLFLALLRVPFLEGVIRANVHIKAKNGNFYGSFLHFFCFFSLMRIISKFNGQPVALFVPSFAGLLAHF